MEDQEVLPLHIVYEMFNLLNSPVPSEVFEDIRVHSLADIVAAAEIAVECLNEAHTKVDDFVSVVNQMSDKTFKENFRLERQTYNALLKVMRSKEDLMELFYPREKAAVNAEEGEFTFPQSGTEIVRMGTAILIALWYLANPDSMRVGGILFGVAKSTVFKCVHKFCMFLTAIKHKFITWPKPDEHLRSSEQGFFNKGFPGAVGAIDGCHIEISCPEKHRHSYTNRKCWTSMILQAVVSSDKLFIDVFVGYPGSVHDARVFRNSGLYEDTSSNPISRFPNRELYILGDSAYPLLPWLITPYRDSGRLTQQQKHFNYRHSAARIAVEHAFGLLKGCWRVLQHLDVSLEFMPYVIMACCVLHNLCLMDGDLVEEWQFSEDTTPLTVNTDGYCNDTFSRTNIRFAEQKRASLMENL
ncbi:uncharacterized protein LOC136041367 [Artemia franciscana]|uniref:DDE Tnp4 domain-containing protein n=1 Tax=Artemia franciscana TaxID=6661 RepID=A0AA88H3J7_ARTSF|nr:hypothetical protein QYM36_017709 [Artemia franciscana]KAK2703959.1 hypothetical protein QYM36_017709 [Artemia franciscana]